MTIIIIHRLLRDNKYEISYLLSLVSLYSTSGGTTNINNLFSNVLTRYTNEHLNVSNFDKSKMYDNSVVSISCIPGIIDQMQMFAHENNDFYKNDW